MHLNDERIELLQAGELPEREEWISLDHIADCATCTSALEAAKREDRRIAELLSVLDHPVPHVDPDELVSRARRGGVRAELVAASIAVMVLAGVASGLPDSPIRSWFSRVSRGFEETAAVPAGRAQRGTFERSPSGVSVLPSGDFELVFETVQEAGMIRISLTDQIEIAVRSDSGGVGYSVKPQAVTVLNSGSVANYELVLPQGAKSIRIRVGDTVIFYKREAEIETSATQPAPGQYVLEFRALSRLNAKSRDPDNTSGLP